MQWVHQLCAPSRAFHLPPQPAHRLVQEWQSWIEQLHITSDANFRITFELVEPDQPGQSAGYAGAAGTSMEPLPEERTNWTLRYYLQARDDPRLLIPAPQVWATPMVALRIGNRRVDRPQERLLAGLGAASRLFPPIARGLQLPRPELAILTAPEAHHFLRETALLLENNGFGVILPAWWDARQRHAWVCGSVSSATSSCSGTATTTSKGYVAWACSFADRGGCALCVGVDAGRRSPQPARI